MTVACLKAMLGHPVAFHAILARICDSATAGLMLSQAVYWSGITEKEEGWFYKSQGEWEREVCLSRREQETARKRLRSQGFWHEQLRGVPATLYFRVDLENLALSIEQYADRQNASSAESAELDWRKTLNKNGGKRPASKAGSAQLYMEARLPKNTAETTHLALPAWLPLEAWNTFVEMRQQMKTPLTPKAIELTLAKLEKLHREGQDVEVILNESVMNGWRGVFPLKANGLQRYPSTKAQAVQASNLAAHNEVVRRIRQQDAEAATTAAPQPTALIGGGQ